MSTVKAEETKPTIKSSQQVAKAEETQPTIKCFQQMKKTLPSYGPRPFLNLEIIVGQKITHYNDCSPNKIVLKIFKFENHSAVKLYCGSCDGLHTECLTPILYIAFLN